MRQMRTQDGYTVKELCATFDVSRSGFYAQGQKAQRGRRQQDARLAEQIGVLFMQSRQTYGCRRLQHQLGREGIRCGKSRIRRLMNQGQLQAIGEAPLSGQNHPEPSRSAGSAQPAGATGPAALTAQPGLDGRASPTCPRNKKVGCTWRPKWTCVPSGSPAPKLDDSLATPLVVDAFRCAVRAWSTAPELHHWDRGVQSMQLPASGKCFKPIRLNPV
jgi:hypothetical protein